MQSDRADARIDMRELCTTVGLVAINWSMIERQIDNVVTVALALSLKKRKRPMQFAAKVGLLQAAFAEIEALRPYAERVDSLLDEAESHAEIRHAFMHGVVDKIESGVITLLRLRPTEGANYSISVDEINAEALSDFIAGLQHLTTQWVRLAGDLLALHRRIVK